MNYGIFLQVLLIVVGIFLLLLDISLLAKRRLSEPISITWGFVAIVMVISGFILRPEGWIKYMSATGMLLLCIIGLCLIYGLMLASCHISETMRKQNEMAMNISLLNQEIVELKKKLAETEKEKEN